MNISNANPYLNASCHYVTVFFFFDFSSMCLFSGGEMITDMNEDMRRDLVKSGVKKQILVNVYHKCQ